MMGRHRLEYNKPQGSGWALAGGIAGEIVRPHLPPQTPYHNIARLGIVLLHLSLASLDLTSFAVTLAGPR